MIYLKSTILIAFFIDESHAFSITPKIIRSKRHCRYTHNSDALIPSKKSISLNKLFAGLDSDEDQSMPNVNEIDSAKRSSKSKTKYFLTQDGKEDDSDLFWGCSAIEHSDIMKNNTLSSPVESKDEIKDEDNKYELNGIYDLGVGKNKPVEYVVETKENDPKLLRVKDYEGKKLSKALIIYDGSSDEVEKLLDIDINDDSMEQSIQFEDLDLDVPSSVYDPSNNIDLVWDLLRQEAEVEAKREPLLVSFLYSTILNHKTLESALAFHLANRLASASIDSIMMMNIILEAQQECKHFGRRMRRDMLAVRDRDPACTCLPDVFLHFKGFHALQSYRVAHYLWNREKKTLAHYVQSQMSQCFQIDIHPKAVLKSGIMLDHGTGLVIGETARVGCNCSILHHVTLGGSGKRGVQRHPQVGDGVLLGAGATLLGNIEIGDGCQVGAGTLVVESLPPHSVAVGVPAKVIGTYKAEEQPSQTMEQVGSEEADKKIWMDNI